MKDLMVHVEKIVRPLHMSGRQKLKMREELLEHLRGIYDEEHKRVSDHDTAVTAAIERFGGAGELSENLKTSVPRYDFVFRCPYPETVPQLTLFVLVLTAVFEIPALSLIARVTNGQWFGLEQLAVYGLVLAIFPVFAAYGLGLAGACCGILGHRKSRRCVVCYTVGFFAYLMAGSLLMNWPHPVLHVLYPAVWTGIVAAVANGFGNWVRNAESHLKEWDSLELESSS